MKALLFQKKHEKYHPNEKKRKTPVVVSNNTIINININYVVDKTKKKKKMPLLKSNQIEDIDDTNSSECSNFKFLDKYDNFNKKNIISKFDQMIEGNKQIHEKSKIDDQNHNENISDEELMMIDSCNLFSNRIIKQFPEFF